MLQLASGQGKEGGHTYMPIIQGLLNDGLHVLQDLLAAQLGRLLEVPGDVLHAVLLSCLLHPLCSAQGTHFVTSAHTRSRCNTSMASRQI